MIMALLYWLMAFIYNFFAGKFGGLKIEIRELEDENTFRQATDKPSDNSSVSLSI